MKKPNFFIIGAAKCGTTALAHYLSQHPEIFISNPKEPRFFSKDARLPDITTYESYITLFEEANEEQHKAVGEASVCYLYSQSAIREIWEHNPKSKIIVMLRNPIDMIYSFHSQLAYNQDEDIEDFEVAWSLQETRKAGRKLPPLAKNPEVFQYKEIARLGTQLEYVLSLFPSNHVKVIIFDEFQENPQSTYISVLRFLGASLLFKDIDFVKVNANKVQRSKFLAKLTEKAPKPMVASIDAIKRMLGIKSFGISKTIRKLNSKSVTRDPLDPKFRSILIHEFSDEVDKIASLTGKNLEGWKRI